MLDCNCCGYEGVNLVPNYEDNTARCPVCNKTFGGISAQDALYDDFSSLKVGDTVKRVHPKGGIRPMVWSVVVTALNDDEIVCSFPTNQKQTETFDRITGINKRDVSNGFITLNIAP